MVFSIKASILENYRQVSTEDKGDAISTSLVCVGMLWYRTHVEV